MSCNTCQQQAHSKTMRLCAGGPKCTARLLIIDPANDIHDILLPQNLSNDGWAIPPVVALLQYLRYMLRCCQVSDPYC